MNVVITGVSRGVGFGLVNELVKSGHRVFGLSRDIGGLNRLKELHGESGMFIGIQCDLTDERSLLNACAGIEKQSEEVEVLINNSGLLINKPFLELTYADWKNVYEVNVFAIAELTKQLYPLLKKGNLDSESGVRSHVINISSMGGVQGSMKFKGLSAYSSSKGAVITITECMAEEFKSDGVRVNCIALGSVETEMFGQAFPGVKASAKVEEVSKWIREFAMGGYRLYNGKVMQLSDATP